ncbi:unnamed protein product [Linum tenue]|uniref:CCHC-type domain-containing protein n=1 Tax=Linum tenue TaxID=586396 RepID=A0AAV0K2P2_9ROSI|nr:unnamed protein product [Linum tenue]
MLQVSEKLQTDGCLEWKNAIIVKPYGGSTSHYLLVNRLHSMWRPVGGMEIIALGNGYSAVKFDDPEDLTRVLAGGPYVVGGNFLAIQMWEPGFDPFSARVTTLLTWVRFAQFPMEFYRDEILYTLTCCVGKPVRIDRQTALAITGRFARICVEVNLEEPLVPKVWVANAWRRVVYEGLPLICSECGRAGHTAVNCNFLKLPMDAMNTGSQTLPQIPSPPAEVAGNSSHHTSPAAASTSFFGEWMVATKRRPRPTRAEKSTDKGNNRGGRQQGTQGQRTESDSNPFSPLAAQSRIQQSTRTSMILSEKKKSTGNPPPRPSIVMNLNEKSDKQHTSPQSPMNSDKVGASVSKNSPQPEKPLAPPAKEAHVSVLPGSQAVGGALSTCNMDTHSPRDKSNPPSIVSPVAVSSMPHSMGIASPSEILQTSTTIPSEIEPTQQADEMEIRVPAEESGSWALSNQAHSETSVSASRPAGESQVRDRSRSPRRGYNTKA